MVIDMKAFLENVLRQKITITAVNDIYEKLPLVYRGRYDIMRIDSNGVQWMAMKPKIDTGLVSLRKDREKLEEVSGLNCAVFFENTTFYIKEKLMEEGIPFAVNGKQVFLPFIGYLLGNNKERNLAPVHLISFLTQKMLLLAIYEKWDGVRVSDAAEKLQVSKKSASRCFDELEYLKIDALTMKGKSRVITVPQDTKKFWDKTKSVLRNPIIRVIQLEEDINTDKKAGISALCEYTLLSDNNYPTYGLIKREMSNSGISMMREVTSSEEIGSKVLELGYFIDSYKKGVQDPLSIVLSMSQEELEDERIRISLNEMLEEFVW